MKFLHLVILALLRSETQSVHPFELQHYFIPTQEQFVVQQSQLFNDPDSASLTLGSSQGAATSSAGAFSFGLGSSAGGINTQQFFGGSFGLGFGFGGGGWYPHPHPFPFISNVDAIGQPKLTDVTVPTLLRPSDTGWDTSYNVPCGSYRIRPFVVANLRLATASSPFHGRRKKRSYGDDEHSLRSYFPHFPIREPRTCSWYFNSDGPCKLKFKCIWFQLPALFSCAENYLFVSDSTSYLNSTFCGNRKPRKVYNSSSGKLKLTFKSDSSSLPAVLDCAVTCSLESPGNGQQSTQNFDTRPGDVVIPIKFAVPNKPSNQTTMSSSSVEVGDQRLPHLNEEKSRPKMRIGDCKCGVQDGNFITRSRVVGGKATHPVEFPWVVALVKKTSSRPFCGGTLISDRYVLTAAHCVQQNKIISRPRRSQPVLRNPEDLFDVLLLEHDINRVDEVPGGAIRAAVDKIIVHPQYDNVTFNFDAALVRLKNNVDLVTQSDAFRYDGYGFNTRVKRFLQETRVRSLLPKPTPICLPSGADTHYQDELGIITGWGLQTEGGKPSDELLKATVQIFNDTMCQAAYKEFNYPVTPSMLCAGVDSGKIDSCVGDSGGGLIVQEADRFTLAGITSWGRGCGRKGQPGVYTKIPGLIEWIRSEASDGVWCL